MAFCIYILIIINYQLGFLEDKCDEINPTSLRVTCRIWATRSSARWNAIGRMYVSTSWALYKSTSRHNWLHSDIYHYKVELRIYR